MDNNTMSTITEAAKTAAESCAGKSQEARESIIRFAIISATSDLRTVAEEARDFIELIGGVPFDLLAKRLRLGRLHALVPSVLNGGEFQEGVARGVGHEF